MEKKMSAPSSRSGSEVPFGSGESYFVDPILMIPSITIKRTMRELITARSAAPICIPIHPSTVFANLY